jgi:hypothetical protein
MRRVEAGDDVADIIGMPSLAELAEIATEPLSDWLNDKSWDDYDC